MDAKELIRLPDPRKNVRVEVREVVREIFGKPHLLLRMRLTGWYFPHRAPVPFVVVNPPSPSEPMNAPAFGCLRHPSMLLA